MSVNNCGCEPSGAVRSPFSLNQEQESNCSPSLSSPFSLRTEETCPSSNNNSGTGMSEEEIRALIGEYLENYALLPDRVISGLETTLDGDDLVVSAGNWGIAGDVYSTSEATRFEDIPNSELGKQRYILIYANTLDQVLKIEGEEDVIAVPPELPENCLAISSVLVGDEGIGTPEQQPVGQGNGITVTGGVVSTRNGRGLTYDETGANTLDLASKPLVTPVISPTWVLYQADGATPYNYDADNITNLKNITVDKGVIAELAAVYQYPAPSASQASPVAVSGSFGSTLPAPDTDSSVLAVSDITTNTSRSVTLSKPKSGLIVSGSQVVFASGNDTTDDVVSISFKVRSVSIYSASSSLSSSDIEAVLNTAAFADNKTKTITANPASDEYVYFILDSDLGSPTSVIQGGTDQVFTAFQFLTPVSYTNAAGATRTAIVMRSNVIGAFPNVTLAFS